MPDAPVVHAHVMPMRESEVQRAAAAGQPAVVAQHGMAKFFA